MKPPTREHDSYHVEPAMDDIDVTGVADGLLEEWASLLRAATSVDELYGPI